MGLEQTLSFTEVMKRWLQACYRPGSFSEPLKTEAWKAVIPSDSRRDMSGGGGGGLTLHSCLKCFVSRMHLGPLPVRISLEFLKGRFPT